MSKKFSPGICLACRTGSMRPIQEVERFYPRGEEIVVELASSRCDHCGHVAPLPAQHRENLKRLAARKARYGGLLLGEEIAQLRSRYGLTQLAAAQIFGKGKIAFSRYENEVSFPDDTMTLLLTLAIEKPDTLKWLADRAGVEIPLWQQRSEEASRSRRSAATAEIPQSRKSQETARRKFARRPHP